MKTHWIALALVATIATTAYAATVNYDYDRTVDFTTWRKFAWKSPVPADESIAEARTRRVVEEGFLDKGFLPVEAVDRADFWITYQGAGWVDADVDVTWLGPGFGRRGRIEKTPMGTLVVEVIDARTGKVAWHGAVTDKLAKNGDEAEKKTAKAVNQLLKEFPPKPASK
jgi:hypothetical protein